MKLTRKKWEAMANPIDMLALGAAKNFKVALAFMEARLKARRSEPVTGYRTHLGWAALDLWHAKQEVNVVYLRNAQERLIKAYPDERQVQLRLLRRMW